MNLVILINSAWMFFRNFGLRHVTAALGHFALELADPNTDQKIITRSADLLNGLRSRRRPQVPEKSIQVQIQSP
jgi:hypothetical protein